MHKVLQISTARVELLLSDGFSLHRDSPCFQLGEEGSLGLSRCFSLKVEIGSQGQKLPAPSGELLLICDIISGYEQSPT
jgi:hypothetical protein